MSSFFQRAHGPDPRQPSALGLATLWELFDHDHAAIVDLLTAALAALEGDVLDIERAARLDDWGGVVAAAHRIKGTSGSIGASQLIEICARLETLSLGRGTALPGTLLAELHAAVERARAEIVAFAAAANEP